MGIQTFTRTIIYTMKAIQFDGDNIEEVFDFFSEMENSHSSISLKSRPDFIPLEINSSKVYTEKMNAWKEKNKEAYRNWQRHIGFKDLAEYATPKAKKELEEIRKWYNDWEAGELYQIEIENNHFCDLFGIKKNDWVVYEDKTEEVRIVNEKKFLTICKNYQG